MTMAAATTASSPAIMNPLMGGRCFSEQRIDLLYVIG
jgi:hypothetical protein